MTSSKLPLGMILLGSPTANIYRIEALLRIMCSRIPSADPTNFYVCSARNLLCLPVGAVDREDHEGSRDLNVRLQTLLVNVHVSPRHEGYSHALANFAALSRQIWGIVCAADRRGLLEECSFVARRMQWWKRGANTGAPQVWRRKRIALPHPERINLRVARRNGDKMT